eukprot:SAG22_NODE_6264_length_877_cov_4.925450_1_plen_66_part_00
MSGVDIDVESLEGAGEYHIEANIIGTTEMLSREAILNEARARIRLAAHALGNDSAVHIAVQSICR